MPKGKNEKERFDIAYKKIKDDYDKIIATEVKSFDEYFGKEVSAQDKEKNKVLDDYLDNLMELNDHKSELTTAQQSGITNILFTNTMFATDGELRGLTALQKRLQSRTMEAIVAAGPNPTEDQIKTVERYVKYLDFMTLGGGKSWKDLAAINEKSEKNGYKKEISALTDDTIKDNKLFESLQVFGNKASYLKSSPYFEPYFNACDEIKKKDAAWKKDFLEKRQNPIVEQLKTKEEQLKQLNTDIENRKNVIRHYHDDKYDKYNIIVQIYKKQINEQTQLVVDAAEKLEKNLAVLERTDKSSKSQAFTDMLNELRQLKEIDPKTGSKKSIFDSISHPNGSKENLFKLDNQVSAREYLDRVKKIETFVDAYVNKKGNQPSRLIGTGRKRYQAALDIQKNLTDLRKGIGEFYVLKDSKQRKDGSIEVYQERKYWANMIKNELDLMNRDKNKVNELSKEVKDLKQNVKLYDALSPERLSYKQMLEQRKKEEAKPSKVNLNRSKSFSATNKTNIQNKKEKENMVPKRTNSFVQKQRTGLAK